MHTKQKADKPHEMSITFLGVRGSEPCSGKAYQTYGGHTSCVLVQTAEDTVFCDAGSGLSTASPTVLNTPSIHILLSHVHMDHIMGLPFLQNVWNPRQTVHIYAALSVYGGIQATLSRIFTPPLFPIPFQSFTGNIVYHDINQGDAFTIGPHMQIRTCPLNHPNGATGYRIHCGERSFAYITDTEHPETGLDPHIVHLLQGVNLFAYDAMYDDATYPQYRGWGHSTWQQGCRLRQGANAECVALFHHNPRHTDDHLHALDQKLAQQHPKAFLARQGMTLYL